MSRVTREGRKTAVNFLLPESVAIELKLLLMNPMQGRSRYGTLSRLMTQLVTDWIAKQKETSDGR